MPPGLIKTLAWKRTLLVKETNKVFISESNVLKSDLTPLPLIFSPVFPSLLASAWSVPGHHMCTCDPPLASSLMHAGGFTGKKAA